MKINGRNPEFMRCNCHNYEPAFKPCIKCRYTVLKIAYLDENRDNDLLEDVADKVLDAGQRAVIEVHRQIAVLKELNPEGELSLKFDYHDILDDALYIEELNNEETDPERS